VVEAPDERSVAKTVSQCALIEGVGFSNAPGQLELIYGQSFFPWVHPLPLAAGDVVEVSLRADLVGADYTWG
jgi:hypothetical protein